MIRLCLFAEWIGICNFSWLLYNTVARITCAKVRSIQRELDSGRFVLTSQTLQDNATALAMQENGAAGQSTVGTVATVMSPTEKIRGRVHPDYPSATTCATYEGLSLFDLFKYL